MVNGVLLQIVQATGTATDTVKQALTTLPQPAGHSEISLSLWDLTLKGGPIMILIALLSVLAIYIFIERFIIISRASKEDSDFMNNIRDDMHNGRMDSALSHCRNTDSPLARMIEKGLQRQGRPLGDINAAIENVGSLEVAKLEKNISYLATIAGGAPMLGFLGTVTGLATAFYDMSTAGINLDIQLLSGGIYQALVATVAGLIVGIVSYFCYNILVTRVQKIVFSLQFRASEFMDMLHEPSK
jgi:biopolymer transport protein ExbB